METLSEIPAAFRTAEATDAGANDGEQVKKNLGVGAVFGEPRTVGETTIIPVARISQWFGAASARPVAVVEIGSRGVRVVPIVDVAALATRAFVFVGAVAIAGILFGQPQRRIGARQARRLGRRRSLLVTRWRRGP